MSRVYNIVESAGILWKNLLTIEKGTPFEKWGRKAKGATTHHKRGVMPASCRNMTEISR